MIGDPRVVRALQACNGPWTFIDETFSTNSDTDPERNFYALAALQVLPGEGQDLRAEILRNTGGLPWHTTEAFDAGQDHEIRRMLDTIASHVEWNVQIVHTPVTGRKAKDTEPVRALALASLLKEVARGHADGDGLVVMDERGDWRDANDRRTFRSLIFREEIPVRWKFLTVDDKIEPLLQAVDTVAWALQRALVRGETQWFEHIADVTTVLHSPTGERLAIVEAAKTATSRTPNGSGRLDNSGWRDSENPASFAALGSTIAGSGSNIDRQREILNELVRQALPKTVDLRGLPKESGLLHRKKKWGAAKERRDASGEESCQEM